MLAGAPSLARRLDAPMVGRGAGARAAAGGASTMPSAQRDCRLRSPSLGPAGIGKSRLAHRAARRAFATKRRCSSAAAFPTARAITFWPLADDRSRGRRRSHAGPDRTSCSKGKSDARAYRGARRRSHRHRRGGGAADETLWAVRRLFERLSPRPPAGRRLRRPPVGGADAARPDRVPGRAGAATPDSRRLPRAAGARSTSARPGRDGDAERDVDPARAALGARRGGPARRADARRGRARQRVLGPDRRGGGGKPALRRADARDDRREDEAPAARSRSRRRSTRCSLRASTGCRPRSAPRSARRP